VLFQENQLRTLQSGLEAKHEEIKLTRIQADRLELELRSRDEHLTKLRSALNTARTNKEYSAILTELNTSKADDSKLEAQILELMKNIETDQAQCLDIQKQIEDQRIKLEQTRSESEGKALELEKEVSVIQKEWDLMAQKVPVEVLQIFKRVAETYDGEATATVEQTDENAANYSCGGCFMGVPAEIVNVLSNRDEIMRCSNCTRILVLEDSGE
jgi:predicted  nucleic acid-binding Zn-ribbon protein